LYISLLRPGRSTGRRGKKKETTGPRSDRTVSPPVPGGEYLVIASSGCLAKEKRKRERREESATVPDAALGAGATTVSSLSVFHDRGDRDGDEERERKRRKKGKFIRLILPRLAPHPASFLSTSRRAGKKREKRKKGEKEKKKA